MNVLNITILAEVIFSYIPNARAMSIYNILVSINNPILEPIRRLQSMFLGDMMIDFSPIVANFAFKHDKWNFNLLSGVL